MRHFVCIALLFIPIALLSQQAPPTQQPVTQSTSPQATPTELTNYAPYSIALLPNAPGRQVVLPFLTNENKLAFFPVSDVQQASKEKRVLGRPISYGELLSLIGGLQIEVNRLQQENEKLWAVVTKQSNPQTVVLQPPPQQPQGPSEAELQAEARQRAEEQRRELLMRFLLGQQQQRVNMNVNVRDCTRFPALCVQ